MLDLRPLKASPEQFLAVQRVLEDAPDYSLRISGRPPGPRAVDAMVTALPPGMTYEDKFVYGIYLEGQMIGCVDLICGFPQARTAMLGLLLFAESFQGRGFGMQAYQKIEAIVRSWPGVDTIRIGILATNANVLPFWQKIGFVDTHERSFQGGYEVLIYEKKLPLLC